jgi:hypothetical protein
MTTSRRRGAASSRRAEAPLLFAYLHLTPQASDETRDRLSEAISNYAEATGFYLGRVLIAREDGDDLLRVHELLEELRGTSAYAVLIAGPAAYAMRAVEEMGAVDVLTLSDLPGIPEHGNKA